MNKEELREKLIGLLRESERGRRLAGETADAIMELFEGSLSPPQGQISLLEISRLAARQRGQRDQLHAIDLEMDQLRERLSALEKRMGQ